MEKLSIKLDRERRINNMRRAINLSWDSLKTHLSDAEYSFDAQSIREYAEIIWISAQELEFLAIKKK